MIDDEVGLGGRYLIQLAEANTGRFPWTRLDVGSPVPLSPDTAKPGEPIAAWCASVASGRSAWPSMRLPDDLAEQERWRLDLSFDEVATQRQRAALEQARLARGDRFAVLARRAHRPAAARVRRRSGRPPAGPQLE